MHKYNTLYIIHTNMNLKKNQIKTKTKIMNILGEEEDDPVCDYLSCYHQFSLHGHRSHLNEFNCVCKSPSNKGLGL